MKRHAHKCMFLTVLLMGACSFVLHVTIGNARVRTTTLYTTPAIGSGIPMNVSPTPQSRNVQAAAVPKLPLQIRHDVPKTFRVDKKQIFREGGTLRALVRDDKCSRLAPKVYVHTEGRTFTGDELNVTRFKDREPRIPKIIHQTWDTYDIPVPAVKFVESVVKKHPEWSYWFWTADDIKCYMETHHKQYLDLYNDYSATIFRTDVMRYFLLYDYGGFYLDLDVECLKPLDIWAYIGSSILSHETYEHTFFGHQRKQPNVMTTILATRPHHPYYKLLQENLQMYHNVCPKNVLYSTGPFYIDNIYQVFLQSNLSAVEENEITVIHPRYWLPTYAGGSKQIVQRLCNVHYPRSSLTPQQKVLCEKAVSRNFRNEPFEDSYLDHHWANSNVKSSKFLTKETKSVFDLVPNLKKVSDILNLNCS